MRTSEQKVSQKTLSAVEREEVTAPDTLDLTERASLGLHGMAGVLNPKANYEFFWRVTYNSNPAYMYPDARSFPTCGPKFLESFPMMLVMTGSHEHDESLNGLKNLLVSWIADDGLMYAPVGPSRPWDTVCPEDWAGVYAQSRMMLAMMALYQLDGEKDWLKLLGKMSDGLARIAIDKGDYAYYPVNMGNGKVKMGEGYCYPKSGWYNTDEAGAEGEGHEGSMFMYHCGPIRALTRWYKMSGDEKAIRMAGKLVNYVMRWKFWGSEYGWPKMFVLAYGHHVLASKIVGYERAHFTGHFHGHAAMLYALIEYANTVNDKHLKEFVRAGYEYSRNQGIARLGLFGETCTISDMIAVAIKLSEGGVGDYWDDVDGYVRNQLIEQQLINADYLEKVSAAGTNKEDIPYSTRDRVIDRTIGIFCDAGDLGHLPDTLSIQCCTGNGTQALYFAWEGIIREEPKDMVQVNLLLNRVSPWMDVNSYLPCEGKVVLKNKTAKTLSLRIPNWVNRSKVECTVDGRPQEFAWIGNYAVVCELKQKAEIVFAFPVEEQTVSHTVLTRQQWTDDPREDKNPSAASIKYTCHFRGNTLVDFSPRPDDRWYPTYQRAHYKRDKTPMKKVVRFVTPKVLKW